MPGVSQPCRSPSPEENSTRNSSQHQTFQVFNPAAAAALTCKSYRDTSLENKGKCTQPMSSSNLITFTDLELPRTNVRSEDSFKSLMRNCHSKHNYWRQPCFFLHYFLVYCPCNGWQPWLSVSIQSHKSSHSWQELPLQATMLNHKGSKILGLCIQAFYQSSGELFSLYK